MIEELLSRDIFEQIGKHNQYWNSEHEIECEKLEEARCQLNGILYAIYEIQEALRLPEEE